MDKQANRTRRSFLRSAALATGTTLAAALMPARPARAQKTPQSSVSYQDKPNNGQKCADCTFFEAPDACKVVAGNISPNGWCKLFTKKP